MDKSYVILYRGDIATALNKNNITNYMILNKQLAVVYVDESFDSIIIDNIPEVSFWDSEQEMSSLIDIRQTGWMLV